jgi:hypothetical protein
MIRLAVFTPDTPPKKVAEVAEPQLGHLEVFDDDLLLAHLVVRRFTNEVEFAIADPASWEWLARVRVPTSATAT